MPCGSRRASPGTEDPRIPSEIDEEAPGGPAPGGARGGLLKGLSEHAEIDDATMWRAFRAFLDRVASLQSIDTVMEDCLDALVEILGADRGMILCVTQDGTPYPIHGRKRGRRLDPSEQAEVSRTTIRQVLDSGEFLLAEPSPGATSGSDSLASFGISGVLAGPLRRIAWHGMPDRPGAGDGPRGAVYLDFRAPHKTLQARHLEFFKAAVGELAVLLDHHDLAGMARARASEGSFEESHVLDDAEAPHLRDLLGPASVAAVRRQLLPVIETDTPILLLGESGTGKSHVARAIALASHRKRPFVRVNLGRGDDRNTVLSELFGHVRGAFTGAVTARVGRAEQADGGTLFLDEVLNLPPEVQPLLLDLLQDGTYEPLGWSLPKPKRVRVRIIAATNGDVERAIAAGQLREDVYYRLAGAVVRLPPLRERRGDIPMLAEQYLRPRGRGRRFELSASARRRLTDPRLPWEGNIRQLQFLLDRAVGRALASDPDARRITAEHVEGAEQDHASLRANVARPLAAAGAATSACPDDVAEAARWLKRERARLDEAEREIMLRALRKHDGVVGWAAAEMGVPYTGFLSRLRTLGLDRPPRRRTRPRPA